MVKWTSTIYNTAAALKTAVEAIDNTVSIQVVPFMEQNKQKFLLIQAT